MLANIFCKGTDSKYFRFCRSCSLCHNYSILTLSLLVAIERCKEMKWSWLCATKASLQSVRSVAVTESFWLFATSWTAACQPSLSITNSWSLLKFKSIDSVMPCNHLILCRPLLWPSILLSQHQGLSQWVSSSHQVAKGLEFQLQHQSFQWIFGTDLL